MKDEVDACLSHKRGGQHRLVLTGDFNVNGNDTSASSQANYLFQLGAALNLVNHVTVPTGYSDHRNSYLDLVLADEVDFVVSCTVVPTYVNTDHE